MALKQAVEKAVQLQIEKCLFLSDCLTLVEAVNSAQPPVNVDWKASMEVYSLWCGFKKAKGYVCKFTGRENNEIADGLARMGRIQGDTVVGYTYPIMQL